MSSQIMKTLQWKIPMAILIASFFFTAIFYFFYYDPMTDIIVTQLSDFSRFSGMWGIGISLFLIIYNHGRRVIERKGNDWYLSILTLIPVVFMLASGLGISRNDPIFRWFVDNILTPVSFASQNVNTFYGVIALYRSFRAKNLGTLIMTIIFLIVCVGVSPLGSMIFPGSYELQIWLKTWISPSMARAMAIIGITSGVAVTIRILLGLEKGLFAAAGGIVK